MFSIFSSIILKHSSKCCLGAKNVLVLSFLRFTYTIPSGICILLKFSPENSLTVLKISAISEQIILKNSLLTDKAFFCIEYSAITFKKCKKYMPQYKKEILLL